jgi:hypothetical protein
MCDPAIFARIRQTVSRAIALQNVLRVFLKPALSSVSILTYPFAL